ncbi:unnamed protein product [Nippostrongylus brasiliensis]|uniref:Transcription initiation factor TFIID subunit 12 n=1 Tax=Nippostrongylus brasiliensis TaxID=27835 RepID=A0A0N4YYB6_NIPBR|nr:unnamed protein product [Nippostrongylus brasiliensis]
MSAEDTDSDDSGEIHEDRFESATQEKAARLVLELADIIAKSNYNVDVLEMAVNVAEDILKRVEAVRRRPISTTSQLINQLVAQSGFVKFIVYSDFYSYVVIM